MNVAIKKLAKIPSYLNIDPFIENAEFLSNVEDFGVKHCCPSYHQTKNWKYPTLNLSGKLQRSVSEYGERNIKINIDKLVFTQKKVNISRVRHYIDNSFDLFPIVQIIEGFVFVLNGHHRFCATILMGQSTIRCETTIWQAKSKV